ncbi:hypothetical protein ACGFWI_37910 [Streptomyces sp. NPDC048434]|uniref:hypothetical protein n=1 Tax=Streptomyces sp. NPDC048434 TaxID=3365549 RepID=UPI0037178F44
MVALPERFQIDDGRHHLEEIVIPEDASTAAGAARYFARCSCGHASTAPAETQQEAWLLHTHHVRARTAEPPGATWKLAILVLVCLAICIGSVIGTQSIAAHLDGAAVYVVRAAGPLIGFAAAFAAMVATRRHIAPTRK